MKVNVSPILPFILGVGIILEMPHEVMGAPVSAPQQATQKKNTPGKGKAPVKNNTTKNTATKAKGSNSAGKTTSDKSNNKPTSNKPAASNKSASNKPASNKSTSDKAKVSSGNKAATPRKRPGAKTAGVQETSNDVKKRQEATQKEIRLTEQQLKDNERLVKNGLNELGKLQTDINTSKGKINATATRITALTNQISGLETGIASNEKELAHLREEYLKAVKKMRLTRRGNSALTFIFASENFNQALRRMRYLRQFSEWKDRQTAAIDKKTLELKSQRENLAKVKNEHSEVLKRQQAEQTVLQQQFVKQDALVAELKQNSTALKIHLSKKQAEANELKNRIATLIAEEQRRAEEAARKAAEEKARKEAEEKARKEAAARKAEEERIAREKALADKAAAEKAKKDKAVADKAKKEKSKADKAKAEMAKADKAKASASSNLNESTVKASAATNAGKPGSAKSVTGDFANMRGRLPRPVSGTFRITSRFGRQSLPDLPDIMYDNPGIDAEVGAGASALAVYGGKVSGVYMIPGYNTVVIVNHGSYYTVYGNISSPSVKVGDQVRAGQGLGTLAPDEDNRGHSSIHFEVWRNREKLNPLEWIN